MSDIRNQIKTLELKNILTKIKNSLEGLNSRTGKKSVNLKMEFSHS